MAEVQTSSLAWTSCETMGEVGILCSISKNVKIGHKKAVGCGIMV